jgi:RHS repeat-associated protein
MVSLRCQRPSGHAPFGQYGKLWQCCHFSFDNHSLCLWPGRASLPYAGSGSSLTSTGNTYYYSLAGRLLGSSDGTTTSFYLTDLLGSVVSTFNNTAGSSAVLGSQLYGPYGNKRYSAGTMGTAKGYTGQYADDLTGFDYYVARYYDPVSARFTSADTVLGNVQGADPYAYVNDNPEIRNDPSGNCPPCLGALVGAVAGGLIGVGVQAVTNYVEHKPLTNGLPQAGVSGAVGGAIIGALGPAGGPLAAAAEGAVAGAVGGAAGKLASNVAAHPTNVNTWGNGVLEAANDGPIREPLEERWGMELASWQAQESKLLSQP